MPTKAEIIQEHVNNTRRQATNDSRSNTPASTQVSESQSNPLNVPESPKEPVLKKESVKKRVMKTFKKR